MELCSFKPNSKKTRKIINLIKFTNADSPKKLYNSCIKVAETQVSYYTMYKYIQFTVAQ